MDREAGFADASESRAETTVSKDRIGEQSGARVQLMLC
jgi:hypothetical protein